MLTDQPHIQISTFGNPYDVGKNQSQPQNQYTIFVIELNTTLNNFISHNRGNDLFWDWCEWQFYDLMGENGPS